LYALYRELYFAMGDPSSKPVAVGSVLPELRNVAAEARSS
jgi:L-ribulokinase